MSLNSRQLSCKPVKTSTFLIVSQCLQPFLGIDHTCISDAFFGPFNCHSDPREDASLYERLEGSVEGLAGGEDGPYLI